MKNLITSIFAILVFNQLFAQTEPSSVYGDLPTKKFYDVSTSRSGNVYKVDGAKVEKAVYDKYHAAWEEFGNCCPCILLTYDKHDVLLREAVQCTDCVVGYYKEFYPNGRLKLHGHYKENPTGDWTNINRRGYCYKENGDWLYYNEDGKIISIETWKDGEFVEQKPKGKKPEIWSTEVWVNDELQITEEPIIISNLGAFEIQLRYKNDHRYKTVNTTFLIGFIGKKNQQFEMPIEAINADKLIEIAEKYESDDNKTLPVKISIYGDNEVIQTINLSLKINE